MPDLFPQDTETNATAPALEAQESAQEIQFGRSWKFDYERGDFVIGPGGRVAEADGKEAWVEWCKKAILTARYRHPVYSRSYGQEFDDLVGRHLSREGNESEIKRIVTETLMLDPRTVRVENFNFQWQGDEVYFSCDIVSVRDETATIAGSVVIS